MVGRQRLLLSWNQIEALVLGRSRLFHTVSLLITIKAIIIKVILISFRPLVVLGSMSSFLIVVEHWLLAFESLLFAIFEVWRSLVIFDPSAIVGLRVSKFVVRTLIGSIESPQRFFICLSSSI